MSDTSKRCFGTYSPGRCGVRGCHECPVEKSCQEDTYCERYDEPGDDNIESYEKEFDK